ncbi:cell surface protein [candidate division BRC1 bacterium HGW-BRC1-1]|jgi:hypothetical protein|nr:MAG: cell surface protein [candidate division BRC1 bacterium HGW-BRC1-1]
MTSWVITRFSRTALFCLTVIIFMTAANNSGAGCFAEQAVNFTPGSGANFGQTFFPANVLGPPNGNSNPNTPTFTEEDLLSLGDGGSVTLKFVNNRIINGPGADFIVFENCLQPIGNPGQSFSEVAIVDVSADGTNWVTMPFDFIPPSPSGSILDMANFVGFAGVRPTLSSPTNGLSPFDPIQGGGDAFDLADVGLSAIQYVRIRDTGTNTLDAQGDLVTDAGNLFTFADTAGFELDAITGIHSESINPSSVSDWALY